MILRPAIALVSSVLCVAAMGFLVPAAAVPTTFFGQDLNGPSTVLGTVASPSTIPNSIGAQNSFLAGLSGVGTETFTGFAAGATSPLNLAFPGAGTAVLNGSGAVGSVPAGMVNANGRYGISGTDPEKFFDTVAANFSLSFSSPIAAFGFFGIDIGDGGGHLSLLLTPSGGGPVVPLDVGNGTSTLQNSSVLFFGFIDPTTTYSQVNFLNSDTGDGFAFDNLTVGSLEQLNSVPEPGSLLLLSSSMIALAGYAWRQRKTATTSDGP